MTIYGVEIPQSIIDSCIERMKERPFRAIHIERVARAKGVLNGKHPVAYRFADRLIQQMRKDRKIIFEARTWEWIGR